MLKKNCQSNSRKKLNENFKQKKVNIKAKFLEFCYFAIFESFWGK